VVATDTVSPHDALALAAAGHAVAAPWSCGVHEYVDGVIAFDPANFLTISAAVQRALAQRPVRIRDAALGRIPEVEPDVLPLEGPLVSLIVRGGGPFFERTMECVAAQRYRSLDVIVSDGAADATPRGELVGFLEAGTLPFPDHVARLVQAAGRSRCGAVVASVVDCFLERSPLSGYAAYGYRVESELDRALGIARREVLATLGDDLWVRLADRGEVTQAPFVGAERVVMAEESERIPGPALRLEPAVAFA